MIKRVGVLRGGTGKNYGFSLKKGGDIISHIFDNLSDKYKPVDILIDKDHIWHCHGVPISPSDLMHKIDIIWNVSHPSLSNILESLSIPNIGHDSFLGTLINNRDMLKKHIKTIGVNMPRHIVLPLYQKDFDGLREKYAIKKAKEIFEKFGSPWIVKSFTPDSSMGIHLAKTFGELVGAIEDGVNHEKSILVEEFISGKNVSIHSVCGFRGEDVYVFPIYPDRPHYNLPINRASFSAEEKDKFIQTARDLYKHLGAEHYLQSSFVLHPKRGIFVTDISFSPDLKKDSHLNQSCEFVGIKMHHIVENILERAL
ncbi:hypothetical protein A3F19_01125 [Candidatus Nomurabacteria bacterium RIFCSPHIGHO2_12_FULL_37_29]|uniref:ATP-grasp domain-containing protein n=1 Tax=Candidatus Nomurabacteria bacterium RIFCSPHIGHO2_12_FULL_37_29 TaxID=1801759 RepID=A0A1F6WBS4_9BACT|nr:MAG: hypothetical protein A2727_02455 [Candidatus Nomurabacteria bacterium RIFCSPHIGHO2_01_FULL_37_110]OGI79360.1 MAG: hypothetical protein A3F19_01125 [Candidatus Nomurabacteria bacterium RIFCSPHIGHO2_12_FULL_37_29]OGI85166.1 MAG: hypothetical protein A3A92_02735 [Candidatus Nomurabacteria bacterium RIFCSPLOWO2_01_FULL_37_49]